MLAPIVLFVYNRPHHTRKVVEALQNNYLAKDSVLFVFSDGPKNNASSEQMANVTEVRNYIHTIEGFKQVVIEEASENHGLANSVIAGVTKVIDKFGKVIVIEDDLVTSPFFLQLLNEELDMYFDDKRIFMVGGYNCNVRIPWYYKEDVYIVHRGNSWGWGTWKNRWDCADWSVPDYDDFNTNTQKRTKFNRGGNDLAPMLDLQMNGKIDSWSIRWDYCMYLYNAYCVYPVKTFVQNFGFDGTGVHCGIMDAESRTAPLYNENTYNISLPQKIKPNVIIERRFKKIKDGRITLLLRIIHKVKSLFI